ICGRCLGRCAFGVVRPPAPPCTGGATDRITRPSPGRHSGAAFPGGSPPRTPSRRAGVPVMGGAARVWRNGRRSRFRSCRRKAWGFESLHPHHFLPIGPRIRLRWGAAETRRLAILPAASRGPVRHEGIPMQVTETQSEGLKRGYQFTLTGKALAETVDQKLAEAQPEIEMKGFRKGKVPMAMLRKQFGARVMGDAMQEAIDAALRSHLEESGHRPATQPKIEMVNGEGWKEGDDLVVDVTYELLPEIPETDFSSIALERLVVPASDEAIDEALANLAKNAVTYKDRAKTTKAAKDDQVIIDFKGMVDGEAFEGGSAE